MSLCLYLKVVTSVLDPTSKKEHSLANHRTAEPRAEANGRVVELVRYDEAALGDQGGQCGAVGRESHPDDEAVLDAEEAGHEPLALDVQIGKAHV